MATVTITWRTFLAAGEQPTTVVLDNVDPGNLTTFELLETMYIETNLEDGPLWDRIKPLSEGLSQTGLSKGDQITIATTTYTCITAGWSPMPSDS